jgi:hypothetical protein
MRHRLEQLAAQLGQAVEGQTASSSPESARRIAQFSFASPGGALARSASCGRPSVLTKIAVLLGVGRGRQDHVGAVRAPVAVAALIDDERARRRCRPRRRRG